MRTARHVELVVLCAAHAKPARAAIRILNVPPDLLPTTWCGALLAGDAMTIDTSVAAHVGWQCLFPAGLGVFINAGSVGCFLYAYFGWDFFFCMVTG